MHQLSTVVWIRNDFFSDLVRVPTFQLLSDPDPFTDPKGIFFSNILNINFTFVFPSCDCVRLFLREIIFLTKKNLYF